MNEATPKTKKQVILIKLNNLQKKLKPFFKDDTNNLFPDISEIDIVDFLFLFNFVVPNGSDYKLNIEQFIESKQCLKNNDELNDVVDLVLPFVIWLKHLK